MTISPVLAADPEPTEIVEQVLKAAGGKENVLTRYRFTDRLRVSTNEDELSQPLDDRKIRTSVIDAPNLWWLKKKEWAERGEETAKWLAYGWTLAVLTDPKASVESLPTIVDPVADAEMVGIRVTGAIVPEMDLYFDSESMLLRRIDWHKQICRFSNWEEFDGFKLPTRCTGYRRAKDQPWYVCEIENIQRLTEIPKEVRE